MRLRRSRRQSGQRKGIARVHFEKHRRHHLREGETGEEADADAEQHDRHPLTDHEAQHVPMRRPKGEAFPPIECGRGCKISPAISCRSLPIPRANSL